MKTINPTVTSINITTLGTDAKSDNNQAKQPKFYDQIDGLRCFCVLGVLFQHFVDPNISKFFYSANIGVDLFFVISGFLITEILINLKKSHSFKNGLKVFYTRRILRIFPLYYLYWGILIAFFYPQVKEVISWGLLYVYNFYAINNDNIVVAGHLWSLAVEEQFYMIWPLVVLLTPVAKLRSLIIIILALSIAFLLFNFDPNSYAFTYNHTFACAVSLLTGALLANIKVENRSKVLNVLPKLSWTPWFAIAGCLALCYMVKTQRLGEGYLIFIRLFVCVGSFYLIGRMALKPFTGLSGKIFMSKIARGIGKISYGIYIYHMLVFILLSPYLNRVFEWVVSHSIFNNAVLKYIKYNPSLALLPFLTLAVIAVSWLSFRLFEMPFLKLKKAFN